MANSLLITTTIFADACYALRKGLPAPYRGVRYHPREQVIARDRSANKELLKLRHAQLRNAIGRIFAVLKGLLRDQFEYPLATQPKMVMALMAFHSMIRDSSDANELSNWRALRYESPAEHSDRKER